MSLMRKILSRGRIKEARQRVAQSPSPSNFALLAQEHALQSELREALRVCEEGLLQFPGNAELQRMAERARRQQREHRLGELREELREGSRPGLQRELAELLLEGGQIQRAEESTLAWLAQGGGGEAQLLLARVRVERFLTDRGREAGQRAFESLAAAEGALPADPRPATLRLALLSAIGAWREARRCVARLLELQPGDAALEARFRALEPLLERSLEPDAALREIERSGRLFDEVATDGRESGTDIRPALRQLATERGVRAALYLRGGTALVQGPRGATAERTARAVRTVAQSARSVARKLGLGRAFDVRVEGTFGTLALALGDTDAGALWVHGELSRAHATALTDLAGANARTSEAGA